MQCDTHVMVPFEHCHRRYSGLTEQIPVIAVARRLVAERFAVEGHSQRSLEALEHDGLDDEAVAAH